VGGTLGACNNWQWSANEFATTLDSKRWALQTNVRQILRRSNALKIAIIALSIAALSGCGDLVPRNTRSLLVPKFQRSEILGFVAGLGTTFAAAPDLIAMLKRRSSVGMKPTMAAIMGVFQILWIYYGLLIASRPVIVWDVIAVLVNFFNVAAYRYFASKEKLMQAQVS